ncbi:hypothetical protein [Nocardioides ferulae]|uniref:hypothetical protein n=1 Tax=Nocardioides ferulae TaxID=2340821 RepID=UPI000EADED0B|nr:hypothetical protein [Nocardioides ferulae]
MADSFDTGPAATRLVESDPFWAVVRRRHPDVDIALLPPPPAADLSGPATPELPALERDEAAARFDAETAALWRRLVGERDPDEQRARWFAAEGDVERYETTWRIDGADPVTAVAAIEAAAATLRDDGWHVLAPPDGMPRVLASRPADGGRDELQLVLAPAEARLVLRLRTSPVRLTPGAPAQKGEVR